MYLSSGCGNTWHCGNSLHAAVGISGDISSHLISSSTRVASSLRAGRPAGLESVLAPTPLHRPGGLNVDAAVSAIRSRILLLIKQSGIRIEAGVSACAEAPQNPIHRTMMYEPRRSASLVCLNRITSSYSLKKNVVSMVAKYTEKRDTLRKVWGPEFKRRAELHVTQ